MKAVRLTHACALNERVFGDTGTPLALAEEEARDLVENLHLARYDDQLQVQLDTILAQQPQQQAAQELTELTEELGLYRPLDDDDDDDPGMLMPWSNAAKADWIAWAVHKGADAAEAAQLTKNELMSRYGERL